MFAALNSFLTRSSGYFLNKSLRFRSSASAYLNRTFAAGNQKTWTWSAWVKRGTLSANQTFFGQGTGVLLSGYGFIRFDTADTISIDASATGATSSIAWNSTPVYRDPAAWYHVVAVLDTTQGTGSDRFKLYVNGAIQSGTFATTPSSSADIQINRAAAHQIAVINASSLSQYFDGEMAEINFVDGQALAPTAFGAYSIYNQWLPIKYAGTYGTNGFYLPFTNTASTSTLVADSSGNANNWTPNNISLTAGSTYDSLTDVPTLTSATVANYCVLNPLGTAGSTPSSGNLAIASGATVGNRISTFMVTSGKWYWEGIGDGYVGTIIGVQGDQFTGSVSVAGSKSIGYWYSDGLAYWDGGASATGTSYTSSDVIGVALDMTAGNVKFYKNNTLIHDLTFGSGTIPNLSSGVFPGYNIGAATKSVNINFGQQPFTYTAPTGFLPLNTFNI